MLLLTLPPKGTPFFSTKSKAKAVVPSCELACCLHPGPTHSSPSPGLPVISVQGCWEQPLSLLQGEGAWDGESWATTQPATRAAAVDTQPWQPFQMANLALAVCGARLEDTFQNDEGKREGESEKL